MKTYLLGKGRKKIVENFTTWNGIWVLGLISGLMAGSMLLYVLGYLHLDGD